ncbi:hypothetical protein MMC17_005847 [Xylographa soralifera]|nr:hypothetical protein [Xylographa soralifera]
MDFDSVIPYSFQIYVCVGITAAVVIFFRYHRKRLARKALIQQHGCKEVPRYPHQERLGSDLVRLRQEALKEGKFTGLYEKQFATYGKTWQENYHWTKVVNSMHWENFQEAGTVLVPYLSRAMGANRYATPFLGKGITTTDGKDWKRARSLVTPIFARAELADIEGLSGFVDQLMDRIPRDGRTVDMQPLLHRMFFDIATEFVFGKSMDSLATEAHPEAERFNKALDKAQAGVLQRRLAGSFSRIRYAFDTSWKHAYDEVHAYVDERVRAALNATSFQDSTADPESDPTRKRYVLLYEMAKQIRDPIELRYQVLAVFIPGRDTTGILVSNALFHLARNQHLWPKLRETALALDLATLTFERLKSLKPFQHVLQETLRLQGPSGRSVRRVERDIVLPRGGGEDGQAPILVEKGSLLDLNISCLHLDRDIWGADVHEFKPERWGGKRPLWEFVPFFGGPRICPANQQVLTQACYTLVRLAREFRRMENRDPVWKYVEEKKMTTQSRNGVKVAFVNKG